MQRCASPRSIYFQLPNFRTSRIARRKVTSIPSTQKNNGHKGLQGLFPVIISTIVRAFKNTAKDPQITRVLPAYYPRKTRERPAKDPRKTREFRGIFPQKKLFLPTKGPETESPLFFRKTRGRKRNKTLIISCIGVLIKIVLQLFFINLKN